MGKLTDVTLRSWMRAQIPIARADGGGLTFTLSAKGTAAWVLRYRYAGKPRELTIGRYPDIGLATARDLASNARAKVQQGVDVAREKKVACIERATAKTFRELASDYMDKAFPTLAPNTVKQRRQHIEGVILPRLGIVPARDVTTTEIVALIETVGSRSKNVAELVFTAISEIFKHGVARHAVAANPCTGISVGAICGKAEPRRQRLKLSEAELRAVLQALPTIGRKNALIVKILLATCARVGELARAEWAHIDFVSSEWVIPNCNSKAGRGFIIPLVPIVADWFKELHSLFPASRYVVPARSGRRKDGQAFFEQRALNAALHRLCNSLGEKVRHFTPHDLRSTARSHLSELGTSVVVAERCLNHSLGGLLAVYDKHDYLNERRAALTVWTNLLFACESGKPSITEGDNVLMLRSAAA